MDDIVKFKCEIKCCLTLCNLILPLTILFVIVIFGTEIMVMKCVMGL